MECDMGTSQTSLSLLVEQGQDSRRIEGRVQLGGGVSECRSWWCCKSCIQCCRSAPRGVLGHVTVSPGVPFIGGYTPRSLRGGWVGWAPACGCALSEMHLVPACGESVAVSSAPGGAFLVYLGEHLKTVARVPVQLGY